MFNYLIRSYHDYGFEESLEGNKSENILVCEGVSTIGESLFTSTSVNIYLINNTNIK